MQVSREQVSCYADRNACPATIRISLAVVLESELWLDRLCLLLGPLQRWYDWFREEPFKLLK